ncbi:nucleotidyltransferase domain-containing protein [archaeon]|nr:nucleotidyltransferase domain-containing protein [archaeon]
MLNEIAFDILDQFFYLGLRRIQVKSIIKNTGYDFKTVKKYLQKFLKLDLVKVHEDINIPTYEANYKNTYFLKLKRDKIIDEIFLSGLPIHLSKNLSGVACLLFGSCARGDYYKNSDIDIFVQAKKINLDLTVFERKLKRKINLFFEEKWQNLNEGMKTGLLNDGVAIVGRLKL